MKKLLSTLLFFTLVVAQAQTTVLKGRVLDKNNFPLPGAIVQIELTGDLTTTDFNGFFTLFLQSDQPTAVKISFSCAQAEIKGSKGSIFFALMLLV